MADLQADKPPVPEKKKESWGETLRFFLILFLGALLLRSLIASPFFIPSGSMLPKLMIGDYLFVSKWPYGYSRYSFPFGILNFDGRIWGALPERGDVVVFRHPVLDEDLIKRVVGLPGDTVEVRGGQVILNGTPLPRQRIADWPMPISANSPCRAVAPGGAREIQGPDGKASCAYPRFRETLPNGRVVEVLDQTTISPGDTAEPISVPDGTVFVMGDNRDDSLDSRFGVEEGGVGLVPVENLIGRAAINFFSTDGSANYLLPWTWFSAARGERIGQTYP